MLQCQVQMYGFCCRINNIERSVLNLHTIKTDNQNKEGAKDLTRTFICVFCSLTLVTLQFSIKLYKRVQLLTEPYSEPNQTSKTVQISILDVCLDSGYDSILIKTWITLLTSTQYNHTILISVNTIEYEQSKKVLV